MATTTRQRLAGGVLIGVAAIAFYIGTQFKGPGLGGSGSGDGGPTPESTSGASTSTDLAGDEATMVSTIIPANSTPTSPSSPVVAVVITGNEYQLSTTGDETQTTPAKLTEVARAALAATGDGQGIRIRIFRQKDATAGARLDLFAKLTDAGIPSEAIQEKKDFLDP